MLLPNLPNRLVVILGPTAVGKTEIAIQLAEQINGEIVSADSRLFYRGMDIGTAKPSRLEMQRVPHHLIDVVDPDQTWSLAVYKQEAERAIANIQGRGKLPLLVGGTGQYISAILEGWQIPEMEPNPRLRESLTRLGLQIGPVELHRRLALIDPVAAGNIQASNLRRTVRALEVILITGKRFSEQRRKTSCPYSTLKIGLTLPRPELYQRIDHRIERMITAGLVDEVKSLLEKGYSRDLPSLSAIGYREIIPFLDGKITLDEAITLIKRSTRQFVRRQANWFKLNDPGIHWFDVREKSFDRILEFLRSGQGWSLPDLRD